MGGDFGQRPGDRREVLDPAQPAARFRHPRAHPVGQLVDPEPGKLRADDPAEVGFGDGDIGHVGGRLRQPLGERETAGEILEVGRGGHHHRVAEPVEFERHRRFGHPFAGYRAAGPVGVDLGGSRRAFATLAARATQSLLTMSGYCTSPLILRSR